MTLQVAEVFGPVIQGEGPVIGAPTLFVRLGGCSYRCDWCDSLHAVMPQHRREWRKWEEGALVERLQELAPPPLLVTLSGGDPAQQDCSALVHLGRQAGYRFGIETQGTIPAPWLRDIDVVVISPKPPSSGIGITWGTKAFNERFRRLGESIAAALVGGTAGRTVAIKVPVFDVHDLDWVETSLVPQLAGLPLYLSVGNPYPPDDPYAPAPERWSRRVADRHGTGYLVTALMQRWRWLAEETLSRGIPAYVLPQLHVLAFGNERAR